MTEKRIERRLAAILAADVVGYSRLTGADEEGTVSRLRALRQELIDPVIAVNGGRTVKRMGDGRLVEFASVVDAVRCALDVQRGMTARNANVAPDKRIEFRVGIHLGDVMVESDGDLMGDGVNIAARLEGIGEPGGICLSEDAWRQVRDKIAEEFIDLGEQSLKNIARPVRAFRVVPAGAREPARDNSAPAAPATARLSIVVSPFANLGGDPEQEYFVDGVTESLTTDLSRIAGSFVIARNTAFTYKGKPFDVKEISRELNVRYVLEGSVQRGGNRMRVNVQLIDAETGNHLWAERFDKPVGDLFDLQDEIVAHLARQLDAALVAAEARRAERAPHPDSIDLCFQGTACIHKGTTPQNLADAKAYFERAHALDPGNVEALVGMAWADYGIAGLFMADDRVRRMVAIEASIAKILSLAPHHAFAHFLLGAVQVSVGRAQGIAECERALALDRNLAMAHAYIGLGKATSGRPEETEAHIREALRLSPRDPTANLWMGFAGLAKFEQGAYEESAQWQSRSIEVNHNWPLAHFALATALVQLGRLDEARQEAAAGLALDPRFTIARWRDGAPEKLARREPFIAGLRQAGVPEG